MPNVSPLRAEDPDRIGRHRLTGRISGMPGAGPFYLATTADGTEVVLRLLRGNWTHDGAARDRFAGEAGSAMRVPPFCAARILDAGVEDDHAYLVSEYVAGKSLLETVSDDGKLRGPELEALAIGSATGLASVHQAGLVHGSFGPEYVIMNASSPRVIEFGITPPYGQATPAADMLAWAQTMVFASMGRPPATLADLDMLPDLLRQAVADCLTGDPAFRPPSRTVVIDLLDDGEPAAGALAGGARRAAQATQSARAAQADWEAQQARGARSGQGGRPARQPGRRLPAGGQRQRRRDRSREDHDREDHEHAGAGHGGSQHGGHGRSGHGRGGAEVAGAEHAGAEHAGAESAGGRRRPSGLGAGRRGRALPIAAAIVAIAVIGVVIVHMLQGASAQDSGSQDSQRIPPATSTSPVSSTVSAAPSPSATVPRTFAGSWSGQAKQVNPSDVFNVSLSLATGTAAGSVMYSSASFSCAGQLSLRSSSDSTLTLRQSITAGHCANGVVTLSADSDGILQFNFRGKTGPATSGTLTRH